MRVLCISDSHGHRLDLAKYKGQVDVVLFSGDYCGYPHKEIQDLSLLNLDVKTPEVNVMGCPGNHDWLFQKNWNLGQGLSPNINWHNDAVVEFMGFKMYFMSWMPNFCDWAFMFPRKGKQLKEKVDRIPYDTDILVTHGPPNGILDFAPYPQQNVGCELLRAKIDKMPNLLLHTFGHVHFPAGQKQVGNTLFVNASQVNEKYQLVNKPILVEVNRQ